MEVERRDPGHFRLTSQKNVYPGRMQSAPRGPDRSHIPTKVDKTTPRTRVQRSFRPRTLSQKSPTAFIVGSAAQSFLVHLLFSFNFSPLENFDNPRDITSLLYRHFVLDESMQHIHRFPLASLPLTIHHRSRSVAGLFHRTNSTRRQQDTPQKLTSFQIFLTKSQSNICQNKLRVQVEKSGTGALTALDGRENGICFQWNLRDVARYCAVRLRQ